MKGPTFNVFVRWLTAQPSRRGLVGGLAAALGLKAAGLPRGGYARNRKKPRPNAFGCLDVGQPCRGKDRRCCSGVCRGKRPRKGARDRSRCVAHDAADCALNDAFCESGGAADEDCGPTASCTCNNTTGRAPHCGGAALCPAIECQRDADCGEPGAACIPAASCQGCGSPATQNFCQRRCGG